MSKPHKFGHHFKYDAEKNAYVFEDGTLVPCTNPPASLDLYSLPSDRACPKCNMFPTAEGHDPCIANQHGVIGACCGHGVAEGYMRLKNDYVIRGDFTPKDIDITLDSDDETI